jgi:hypothetical protein
MAVKEGDLSHQTGCVGEEGRGDQRRCDEFRGVPPHDGTGDLALAPAIVLVPAKGSSVGENCLVR